MLVDGKKIASRIRAELKQEFSKVPKQQLIVIAVEPTFATKKFIGIKKKFAEDISVVLVEKEFPSTVSTEELVAVIQEERGKGIVVQLPLPSQIDTQKVLDAISEEDDVDGISSIAAEHFKEGRGLVMPPVVGAMAEILNEYHIELSGKNAVIVGSGRLVGIPAASWLAGEGTHIHVATKGSLDLLAKAKEADILILGAGDAGFIKKDMIKKGVVLLDAGTSEEGGELRGDADPVCAEIASLFTPVPGGIGPITVAMIFKNLLVLSKKRGV